MHAFICGFYVKRMVESESGYKAKFLLFDEKIFIEKLIHVLID